ncbi:MAG: CvpA family protein [Gammaproteobacteria bacterium]|nr:CvpA family protein [Gammaproteobacteria bacterium]
MSNWNGLDFFIFLIFFLNTVLGMSRGATKEIISMMCLSAALIFTIRFTVPLAAFFDRSPLTQDVLSSSYIQNFMAAIGADPLTENFLHEISYTLSVLVCFVGVFSVTEAVLISSFAEVFTFPYAVWNRKVGAALGATRGYVLSVLLIMLLVLHIFKTDNGSIRSQFISGSYFVGLFTNAALKMDSLIGGQDVEHYHQIFEQKNLFNEKNVMGVVQQGSVVSGAPAQ